MFTRPWFWIPLLLLVWAGCGFYAGDQHRNNAWLIKEAQQQRAALATLQEAQARGDALAAGWLTQQAQIDQLKQEAHDAVKTSTTGRTCFDGAALRVLKHAPGITLVPTAPSSAAAAGGAPATVGSEPSPASVSSDTQVALWAVDAAAAYETCRTRLDTLIDWHVAP